MRGSSVDAGASGNQRGRDKTIFEFKTIFELKVI